MSYIITIDATNIITGGGLTHLAELLNNVSDEIIRVSKIKEIHIIAVNPVLDKIQDRDYLHKIPMGNLEGSLLKRLIWKFKNLDRIIAGTNCNIVFNPGGSFFSKKYKYITVSQNMLVFEKEEAKRFPFTLQLRFRILNVLQTQSINNAAGVIFISEYAKKYIGSLPGIKRPNNQVVIPHGVSDRFRQLPRVVVDIASYSNEKPFRIVYVSVLDVYKHHDKVAQAVANLYHQGYPVTLTVVGGEAGGYPKFKAVLNENKECIEYLRKIPFEEMERVYHTTDMFVFASTCENMPNIVIEAMSAGLPIASSEKMPMPEFLQEAGVYFNALDVGTIEKALIKLMEDKILRQTVMEKAYELSQQYSWTVCAQNTFKFITATIENGDKK
ncbi:glycosyltransferase [Flavobacterium sp. WV_118_3]|uniref:glycosyltransferase n=1 Tax=Flavobacterium sp. WV_118_3 TaxID=3151764 RepID=UPI00321C26EF